MQIHKLVYVSSEDIPSSNHFFHGYFIPKPKNCGQLRWKEYLLVQYVKLKRPGKLSRMAGRHIDDLQNLGKSCWLITCKNVISVKLSNQLRHVSALFRSYRLRMTIKNKQGHPTTAFCKISVRRSKFYPEFFITWGRQKSFRWPSFHSCRISGAYLINSLRFPEV